MSQVDISKIELHLALKPYINKWVNGINLLFEVEYKTLPVLSEMKVEWNHLYSLEVFYFHLKVLFFLFLSTFKCNCP